MLAEAPFWLIYLYSTIWSHSSWSISRNLSPVSTAWSGVWWRQSQLWRPEAALCRLRPFWRQLITNLHHATTNAPSFYLYCWIWHTRWPVAVHRLFVETTLRKGSKVDGKKGSWRVAIGSMGRFCHKFAHKWERGRGHICHRDDKQHPPRRASALLYAYHYIAIQCCTVNHGVVLRITFAFILTTGDTCGQLHLLYCNANAAK